MIKPRLVPFAALCASLVCGGNSKAESIRLMGHTPPFTQTAKDLGKAEEAKPLRLRFWLKHRDLDRLAQYAEEGRRLSKQDVENTFHPSADQAAKVKKYLLAKGFKNVQIARSRRYITAESSVGHSQNTFQMEMHRYSVNQNVVIANAANPALDSEIADSVSYIGGLSHHVMQPLARKQRDLDSGKEIAAQPFVIGPMKGSTHETVCFGTTETDTFLGPDGVLKGVYSGNRFGSSLTAPSPQTAPCGYGPKEVQAAYGIDKLVQRNLDGTGQTIVIVDAYGSPTVENDAKAFSQAYGLPLPQVTVYQPSGPTVTGAWTADQQGWAGETTLDVEYAHTMAPGAKIALVEAASASDDDLDAAIAYAIDHDLGNQISNSWSGSESQEDQAGFSLFNTLVQTAIVKGISIHFSSGDDGDSAAQAGYSDVGFPGSSPYITSVGGTTLALNSDLSVLFHAGWGNNGMRITDGIDTADASAALKNPPLAPPTKLGFIGGAGGGASRVFKKPSFQKRVKGTGRMQPDIAYLADPYTGVEVVESTFDDKGNPQDGTLSVEVIGGTSLACPMFSGMWAIANQAHGSPLGQAAPLLYSLNAGAIIDVVPVSSPTNVTGTVTDSKGNVTPMGVLDLALPQTGSPFYSALYNSPHSPYRWNVITFGTDSSLSVTKGWDSVTGLGVPNGEAFVQALQ